MNSLFHGPSMGRAINIIEMDVPSDMHVLGMHDLVYIRVDQV